jgi:hypothetical protein
VVVARLSPGFRAAVSRVRVGGIDVSLAPLLKPRLEIVALGRCDFLAAFKLAVDEREQTFSLKPYVEPADEWLSRQRAPGALLALVERVHTLDPVVDLVPEGAVVAQRGLDDPIAVRLDAELSRPFVLSGVEVAVSASIGIALTGRGIEFSEEANPSRSRVRAGTHCSPEVRAKLKELYLPARQLSSWVENSVGVREAQAVAVDDCVHDVGELAVIDP